MNNEEVVVDTGVCMCGHSKEEHEDGEWQCLVVELYGNVNPHKHQCECTFYFPKLN